MEATENIEIFKEKQIIAIITTHSVFLLIIKLMKPNDVYLCKFSIENTRAMPEIYLNT